MRSLRNKQEIQFQCAVYMGNHGINVYSNSSNIGRILSRGEFIPFIPGYRLERSETPTAYSLVFLRGRYVSAKFIDKKKTLVITGSEEEIAAGKTIPYMIHFMLEQQRQEDGQATLSGAGIALNQQGILLIGKRGSGKTSISLELCRKYNYSLVGNALVIIGLKEDSGYLFEGTKIFTLRLTTVKYYNTDLQKYFPKERTQDEWTSKVDILPEELEIAIERNPVKIVKAFYVHLENDPSTPLFVKRIHGSDTLYMGRLYLYEELSRYIRGACIPIFKGSKPDLADYLPSLDKPEYHQKRLELINWIMEDLGLYYISGSMDVICNYINLGIK